MLAWLSLSALQGRKGKEEGAIGRRAGEKKRNTLGRRRESAREMQDPDQGRAPGRAGTDPRVACV